MQSFNLKPRTFGFVVGTRAALAFGIGLLVASRIPEGPRKRIGLALLGIGAATTVPAIRLLRRSRTEPPAQQFHPAQQYNPTQQFNGAYSEFGFAKPR